MISQTHHPHRGFKALTTVSAVIFSSFILTACVGPPASEWKPTAATTCPIPSSDAHGTIRIGYLGSLGADLFLYDRGVAEACMPNADVKWTRFPTGQDIVKGFASDSVDVAGLGSTPSAKALSGPLNLDVSVTQVNAQIGAAEALVAKSAKRVKELRGKTIAVPFSSTSHYSLLNALHNAGLIPKHDVTITNVSPDNLPAAWASSKIDAAYVWEPALSAIKGGGNTIIDSTQVAKQGAATYNITLASNEWSRSNPKLLETWTALQNWAVQSFTEKSDDFTEAIAAQADISKDSARTQIAGSHLYTAEEQPQALEEIKTALFKTANFLNSEGEVNKPKDENQYRRAVRYGRDNSK